MSYEAVIGLEVHAQLKTQTKIFCACSTAFGAAPNQNTCPVCLGLPGALPALNKDAVELAILLGLALGCSIQRESIWERKNYFYPDLPKGYQISQFAKPLCLGGHIDIELENHKKRITLTRIHMEEDAGKSIHDAGDERFTHIDLNRAGTPLCEIVSEPELSSGAEAAAYLKNLRSIVRYAGVCDGNMEQGSLRCDANVSVKPTGQKELGTKVEIKNLNSIKFIEKAINYEIERQIAEVSQGKAIHQETRLFDSHKGITVSMRSKEDSHDYRYFPDPDLVPLIVEDEWIEKCQNNLPELAEQKITRFVKDFGLSEYDASVLVSDQKIAEYFEDALTHYKEPKKIANWIMTDLLRELKDTDSDIESCLISAQQFATLVKLIDDGTLSGTMAKKLFKLMYSSGDSAEDLIQKHGMAQISDTSAIEEAIDAVIAKNPDQVNEFKAGKTKVFGFLVGQVMRATKGKANPQVVNDLLKKKLS